MTEFDKLKIGFVLALLGTVFALHPIVQQYQSVGYEVFSLHLTLWRAYVTFALSLSTAVYLYAITVLTARPLSWVQRAGDAVYALSLLIMPTFFVGWLAIGLAALVRRQLIREVLAHVLTLLVGLVGSLLADVIFRRLGWREKKATVRQLTQQEADHMRRADQMLTSKHYDLVAIESARAIEAALRRALVETGLVAKYRGLGQLVEHAIRREVISANARNLLDEIRHARNMAVHSVEPIPEETARNVADSARRILAMVRYPSEETDDSDGA